MKFISIERETCKSSTIINLDNIDHIDINTKSNTCQITYASRNTITLAGNELAQLLKGVKQYNDQLLINLCGEREF